ncbi:MAG: Putative periplasmic protein [uncultured Sulfurovum sp.]|uniref:Periplasmic protein n=1 Tax=uncultured Sulfurovum sp. TaxID=269237 RepID=A0A6S6T944_9BACT|nr:MAG: Putative periplasmic protein [uncultured Sulfurovum sp.]
MKALLSFLLLTTLLFTASVESKIQQSTKQLNSKKNQYNKMDRELSQVAKKINIAKKEQNKLAKKLSKLAKNIKKNEVIFNRLQKEDKEHSLTLSSLSSNIDENQQKFLDLVAKNFSLALALEELKQPTKDSVMMKEAYKLYAKKNSKEIEALRVNIDTLKIKKERLKLKKLNIKKAITTYETERTEYRSKKKKQDLLVKNLARDRAIYKKRFNKIKTSRRNLERKLAKLKIIKRTNDEEIRAKEERRESTNNHPIAPKVVASIPKVNYKGGKTISPLKGARLIKKFGTYIDPIYKFKIFNKSITLKAPHTGSKVRTVLAGKVVFAENSGGMLGKVVIVEHAKKMHTIYAKLSRLAPGIHVGKKISTGVIIGKVDKSLMFEVTKNNKHMNPLKLIKL